MTRLSGHVSFVIGDAKKDSLSAISAQVFGMYQYAGSIWTSVDSVGAKRTLSLKYDGWNTSITGIDYTRMAIAFMLTSNASNLIVNDIYTIAPFLSSLTSVSVL